MTFQSAIPLISFLMAFTSLNISVADDLLKNQVLKEAPKEWSRFRERSKHHLSTWIAKTEQRGDKRIAGKVNSQSRGNCKLYIEEILDSEAMKSGKTANRVKVYGINEQYYFHLQAEKREGPFKLVKLQKRTPEDIGQSMPEDMLAFSWPEENDFLFVDVEALPEIFSKSYFQLQSAEYLTEGEHRYIRCKVSYDHQKRDQTIPYGKAWIPYKEFTVDLDPENYYQIRRVTYELSNDKETYVFLEEISQGAETGGPLYISEHKAIDKPTGKLLSTKRKEYVERSFTAPPKANFYLTAFGLPEPPGLQKKGVPVFVWFVAAGLIAVIAALFWQRSRKTVK